VFRELSSRFGHPNSEILPKILERLVSYEEAVILLALPGALEEVSNKTKTPISRLRKTLESLFKRSLILRETGKDKGLIYALCGNLIDSTLMEIGAREARGEPLRKVDWEVINLWDEFFEDHLRTAPKESHPSARIVPVNKAIPMDVEVLPYEVVSKIVQEAKIVAVAQCPCRTRARRCDNPTETCLLLDEVAVIALERNIARKITVEEAIEILTRCEDLGLVHNTNNASHGLQFICNCCPCCCAFLRRLIHYGRENATAKSRYQSVVNESLCIRCGICEGRCVFGAIKVKDGVAQSDPEKCFGCGLCISKCPTGAISLILARGKEHIPVKKADTLLSALRS